VSEDSGESALGRELCCVLGALASIDGEAYRVDWLPSQSGWRYSVWLSPGARITTSELVRGLASTSAAKRCGSAAIGGNVS
jgi:hypothetical protein